MFPYIWSVMLCLEQSLNRSVQVINKTGLHKVVHSAESYTAPSEPSVFRSRCSRSPPGSLPASPRCLPRRRRPAPSLTGGRRLSCRSRTTRGTRRRLVWIPTRLQAPRPPPTRSASASARATTWMIRLPYAGWRLNPKPPLPLHTPRRCLCVPPGCTGNSPAGLALPKLCQPADRYGHASRR
jgi:hypothetical protein